MFKNLSPETLGFSGRQSEVIELALSYGFKGLDLEIVEFAREVAAQGFAKASRLITSARLKVGSFVLPVRWQHDDSEYQEDLKRLDELAAVAGQLGCTRATTLVEPASEARPYHENFEFHRRRLAELATALAAHQIRLGVGFLAPKSCRQGRAFQFMQTVDELLLLVRSVAAPGVGLALDSWHWQLGGGKLDALRSLGAHEIITVTLADGPAGIDAADVELSARRLPGDGGAIDNAGLLAVLAQLRYDGPVTPAPDKQALAGLGRDAIVKQAGAALDAVWKAAGLNPAGKLAAVTPR